jgi:hypothetical protein
MSPNTVADIKVSSHKRGYCADGVAQRAQLKKVPAKKASAHSTHTPEPEDTLGADGLVASPEVCTAEPKDSPPQWPQPQGIFIAGIQFNPEKFLFTVRDIYERVVDGAMNGTTAAALSLEDQAFLNMLESRIDIDEENSHTYFRLYDLEFTQKGSYTSLVSEREGRRYLRIDCL